MVYMTLEVPKYVNTKGNFFAGIYPLKPNVLSLTSPIILWFHKKKSISS